MTDEILKLAESVKDIEYFYNINEEMKNMICKLKERNNYMPKQTKDMAAFIKNAIPATIPETYSIKPLFKNISNDESIRKGVLGFRNFLYRFCDYIIKSDTLGGQTTKKAHEFEDNTSLSKDFPYLNNLESILVNIGLYGELTDDNKTLVVDDCELLTIVGNANLNSKNKMLLPKLIEGLRHLGNCGICFEGIDLNEKRLDMLKVESLKVSYHDDPNMLIGMKIMAIAQSKLRTSGHEDFFLCCDYKILKEEDSNTYDILKDIINPLSNDMKKFVLEANQLFIEAGLLSKVESKYFRIKIIYSYKSKDIFTFSSSINGISLTIKSNNISKFPDIIERFPLYLQHKISKGFGCYRKTGGDHCEGACQGFRFPLNDSFLLLKKDIEIWLEKELSSLK